jgi:hypothetical protein
MHKSFVIICYIFFGLAGFAQGIKLKNSIVIGQFDKIEDRYAVEVNLTELLINSGIKAAPSINILKQGESAFDLATDSIRQLIQSKGFDTYLIVTVRGYDRKFKPSEAKVTLIEMLNMASLYHIYRDEVSSVSFEFTFFRNDKVVHRDVIRCSNVSNRDSVIKRLRKKLPKLIEKEWKS